MKGGILRHRDVYTPTQAQTQAAFYFLWSKEILDEPAERFQENWFEEHFPGLRSELKSILKSGSRVLDAGCGAGFSALAFFGAALDEIQYVGVDISRAIEHAERNFRERHRRGEFIQDSITALPFRHRSFDFIFTPGVLHHTDSIAKSLTCLSDLLVPGGSILLWVYKKQPPLREFADALLRRYLADMNDEDAFQALIPLTKLGEALGQLQVMLDVPEDIPYLGIPKGTIDLQRFMYYYVLKTFYNPSLTFERANFQNFDWYRPLNAHTSTPEDVQQYCADVGLRIDRERVSPSGVAIVATRL
jgi:SAM-dependent methyltransferase